jgi:hypothetical protein
VKAISNTTADQKRKRLVPDAYIPRRRARRKNVSMTDWHLAVPSAVCCSEWGTADVRLTLSTTALFISCPALLLPSSPPRFGNQPSRRTRTGIASRPLSARCMYVFAAGARRDDARTLADAAAVPHLAPSLSVVTLTLWNRKDSTGRRMDDSGDSCHSGHDFGRRGGVQLPFGRGRRRR